MARFRLTALFLVLALVAGACAEEASDTEAPEAEATTEVPEEAEAAVEALAEEWVTHYNLHHPDMVADLYTEDATVVAADLAVDEGRDAIASSLAEAMEGSPTVSVSTDDVMVFGDRAVARGTYSVETTLDDAPVSFGGAYINLLRRVDDEWRIQGLQTNYDSPRPDGWNWAEFEDQPDEDSAMTSLIEEFETHWNLQHPDMVADLYTEDAAVSFADAPVLEGRDAVAQWVGEQMETQATTLDIHGVDTTELDDTHRLDVGWYELFVGEGEELIQTGMYVNLLQLAEDGSWKILWEVNSGRPASTM